MGIMINKNKVMLGGSNSYLQGGASASASTSTTWSATSSTQKHQTGRTASRNVRQLPSLDYTAHVEVRQKVVRAEQGGQEPQQRAVLPGYNLKTQALTDYYQGNQKKGEGEALERLRIARIQMKLRNEEE